jgi:hypothetical protein
MPLGEPFAPTEPEWLIRSQAGLPPIKKTSELPRIIPPLPTGDTKDLKVWKEYWKQHDAQVAKAAREQERQRINVVIKELEHLRDGQYNDVVGHNVRYAYDYAIILLRAQQGGVSK